MSNSSLHRAKREKNDEFYTQYEDIAKEVQHYKQHFQGKNVLLNANDAKHGHFWDYFNDHYKEYGLASLTATSYGEGAFKRVRDSAGTRDIPLQGDGDFRSAEMLALLHRSDIVVTNPPFSLFREFLPALVESGKQFLVIGNMNAITYKEVWPHLQYGRAWLGGTPSFMGFQVPDDSESRPSRYWEEPDGSKWRSLGNATWFTNLDHERRHEEIPLTKTYSPESYPRYDNFDAIEVGRVADIPKDYNGLMGVPITFLGKHNPEQFEVLDANDFRRPHSTKIKPHGLVKDADSTIQGKAKYVRILIRPIAV